MPYINVEMYSGFFRSTTKYRVSQKVLDKNLENLQIKKEQKTREILFA